MSSTAALTRWAQDPHTPTDEMRKQLHLNRKHDSLASSPISVSPFDSELKSPSPLAPMSLCSDTESDTTQIESTQSQYNRNEPNDEDESKPQEQDNQNHPCARSQLFNIINSKFSSPTLLDDGQVVYQPFVDAVFHFCRVFDALGQSFQLVKSDMNKNLVKISQACSQFNAHTLQEMIKEEEVRGVKFRNDSGTTGLLWLKRTLQFIMELIRNIVQSGETLSLHKCAHDAYERTLRRCHNFILAGMFHAGLNFLPGEKVFFDALGPSEYSVRNDMAQFIEIFSALLERITRLYIELGLEKNLVNI